MHKRPRLRLVVDNTRPATATPRPYTPGPDLDLLNLAAVTRIARHYTREINRIDRKAEAVFQAERRALERGDGPPI